MSRIDLARLVRTLEPELRVSLEAAASLAARNAHETVDIAHWLRAALDTSAFAMQLEDAGASCTALRLELDAAISAVPVAGQTDLSLSQNVLSAAREAWLIASLQYGRQHVTFGDLLIALSTVQSLRLVVRAVAPTLREVDLAAIEANLENLVENSAPQDLPSSSVLPGGSRQDDEFLRLYTQDMTADARAGRIDPVIGREKELRQVIHVLMRRRQNNPILVGEAGVGKTAIAEALALEIISGNVPDKLKDVRLLSLDLGLLQAGAGVKGEFERRLHGVIDAVKSSPVPVILFVDEAHTLIGAGGQGSGDAANILKPSLARGELRTVAATTWGEYKRYIEKDAALTRRFQTVKVDEPDEDTAIRMMRGVVGAFRAHHKVRIRDEALVAAVKMSARYIPERQLPDKAISLIDTAAATVTLGRQTMPEELKALHSEETLLLAEAEELAGEPGSPETTERLARITERRDQIAAKRTELEDKFQHQLNLVREIDRLDALLGTETPSPSAEADAKLQPFPLSEQTRAHSREALADAEQKLVNIAGETPLIPVAVDREVIAGVVARWTGIPVGKLLSDQVATVQSLNDRLKERVVGQDAVLARLSSAMRISRAGLSDPRRPPAVFLLVGMSGTGKTETALALADLLYGGSQYLTTINMSEFKEEHKVSMLLGSPPGYVGYGEGGVLTEAVRRRPYGVLLLDEIDKAHPGVQDIFYQMFDKGTVRDSEGRDVDFKNTTIIMTANAGSELLHTLSQDPDTMPEGEALEKLLFPELKKQFKPAFLGRTIILPYQPLSSEALSGIVDLQIGRVRDRVAASYGAGVTLSDAARKALISRAKNSEMGARAIETMIARDLLPALAGHFLENISGSHRDETILIEFKDNRFTVEPKPAEGDQKFAPPKRQRAKKAASARKTSRPAKAANSKSIAS
jgi:type VI secretion system protein VasG